MLLKDLPPDARPREKLLARGPGALSDAELLALLLRTGLPGKNALQMGQELIGTFGGVSGLLNTPAEALKKIKGLGPAKRAEIVAVLELARRALASQLKEKTIFRDPQAMRDYLQLQLGGREHEIFAVLFLDTAHRLIVLEEMFRGTLTQTSVYPREVVVRALALAIAAFFAVSSSLARWMRTAISAFTVLRPFKSLMTDAFIFKSSLIQPSTRPQSR